MKNIILIKAAIVLLVVIFIATAAQAGRSVQVFEMGESGIMIEFPVTPGELAAEDAANSSVIAARSNRADKLDNTVIVFEMGEGGHIVEFRATAEEITAAQVEDARRAAFKSKRPAAEPHPAGDRFEMAENGGFIVFPPSGIQTEWGDLVIALDKMSKDATGTQQQ